MSLPESLLTLAVTNSEIIRLVLLFAHLLLCAFALTQVLRADLGIILGKFDPTNFDKMARETGILLALLWVTGFVIVYIDTGFNSDVLGAQPKLLLKLMCVVALTANGLVLHRASFPLLTASREVSVLQSVLLVSTGALSTSHWLMAAFIGMAKPLAQFEIETLLLLYCVITGATVLVSLVFCATIRRRLAEWRQSCAFNQLREYT